MPGDGQPACPSSLWEPAILAAIDALEQDAHLSGILPPYAKSSLTSFTTSSMLLRSVRRWRISARLDRCLLIFAPTSSLRNITAPRPVQSTTWHYLARTCKKRASRTREEWRKRERKPLLLLKLHPPLSSTGNPLEECELLRYHAQRSCDRYTRAPRRTTTKKLWTWRVDYLRIEHY